jgi:two-component system, sensor histidine kinase and response regulator
MLSEIKKTNYPNPAIRPEDLAAFSDIYPYKILIAEDNVVNQKIITHLLNRLGYKIDFAETGQEVIDAYQRQHYNIILMDVHMPELSGIEATRFIRNQQEVPQPVIIAMTASGIIDDREICLQEGMDDYIDKPVLLKDLMDMLIKWCKN